MSRPSKFPRWATDTGGSEPLEEEKDDGWETNEVPPSGYMNWLQNLAYQWLVWLDSIVNPLVPVQGALAGITHWVFYDDFDRYLNSTTATNSPISDKFACGATSNGAFAEIGSYGPAGTFGAIATIGNTDAAASFLALANRVIGFGTKDFYFRTRVNVQNKAKIDAVALDDTSGLFVGFRGAAGSGNIGFAAGSDQANWRILIDGVSIDSTFACNNDTWYDLELYRISGLLYCYVNSVISANLNGVANTTNYTRDLPLFVVNASSAPGAANFKYFYIDSYKLIGVR